MLPDLETDFETPNMVSFLPIYFTIVQLLEFYFPKTEYSQLQIRYHHSPRFQSLIDKITSIYKCLKFSFEMYCQNRFFFGQLVFAKLHWAVFSKVLLFQFLIDWFAPILRFLMDLSAADHCTRKRWQMPPTTAFGNSSEILFFNKLRKNIGNSTRWLHADKRCAALNAFSSDIFVVNFSF